MESTVSSVIDMSDVRNRFNSFKNVTLQYVLDIDIINTLARTGIYYRDRDKFLACFFCNLHWEDWDDVCSVIDNHKLRSPNCAHSDTETQNQTNSGINIPTSFTAYGVQETDDQHNIPIPIPNLPSMGNPCRTQAETLTYNLLKTAHEEVVVLKKYAAKKSEQVEELKKERNTLAEENVKLKEIMCKICLDNDANIVFLPCGHMVSCVQCANEVRKCALCRKFIERKIKTFM